MTKRFIIFVAMLISVQSMVVAQQRNYLSEGNALLQEDKNAVLGALNIWITGYSHKMQQGKTDLALSFKIIKTIASRQIKGLYNKAHNIYFESINNADPEVLNTPIFEREVRRMLPLLDKANSRQWKRDLKNRPFALREKIKTFWQERDPVISTPVNERLIEHYSRIHYAQLFFTEDSSSVYGTDIRGMVYVRLGEPDERYTIEDSYRRIQAPDGFSMLYLDSSVEVNLEVWIYGENGEDHIVVFGQKYGFGSLSILENLLDGIDFEDKYIVDKYGQKYNISSNSSSRGLVLYGLLNELKAYHSRFDELYLDYSSRLLRNVDKSDGSFGNYNTLLGKYEAQFNFHQRTMLSKELSSVARQESDLPGLLPEVSVAYKVFRFFDEQKNLEYALAVQPSIPQHLSEEKNYPLIYSANLIGSGTSRNFKLIDTTLVDFGGQLPTQLYTIKEEALSTEIEFVAELFYSKQGLGTPKPIYFPQNIAATSGRRTIEFPKALVSKDVMFVSDIMLGKSQDIDLDNRYPFVPVIQGNFTNDEDLLLYYEAYNIPKGGYTIEYTISKYNFLGIKRALKARQRVTIVEDEVVGNQEKYLFVDLSDLESGKFEFEMNFIPNETDQQKISRTFIFNINQ